MLSNISSTLISFTIVLPQTSHTLQFLNQLGNELCRVVAGPAIALVFKQLIF
jgi:hypothetical protein